jgi:DNA-binding LacI/PurR family transcriptional regulator
MTIYEIAKRAGVSVSTVSRVVNGKPGVGEAVRERVKKLLADLDYAPNLLARELSNRRTNVIGIVMPGINDYFTERIDAINGVCRERGYSLMITANTRLANDVESEAANLRLLYERRVEGILFFATRWSDAHREALRKITADIPVVALDRIIEDSGIPCVLHDNPGGARKMMRHLLSLGHRRIAFLRGPSYDETSREREDAWRTELAAVGFPAEESLVRKGNWTLEGGRREGLALLSSPENRPTAIFAGNDNMALGVLRAAYELGLRVPADLSVAGYDGSPMGGYSSPTLSTVGHDQTAMGVRAGELLFEVIGNRKPEVSRIVLEDNLIARESTGPVPR